MKEKTPKTLKLIKKKIKKIKRRETNNFFIFKSNNIVKIVIILILISIIFNANIIYVSLYSKNEIHNETIIESNEYKSFNEIKNKLTDPTLVKILKDIHIIKHLYSNEINYHKKNKNIIHVTYGINNDKNYKYIVLVSMYSLLSNCNKNKSFIIIHLLCTPDINETIVEMFKSLVRKFPYNTEIILYNMGNHFSNRKNFRYSEAAYYRVLCPFFIDSDRIIHLDGDTLVYQDLKEMYNLEFDNNYILGMYDFLSYGVDYLGLKSNIYINAGIILLNLEKIRKDNKSLELIDMVNSKVELRNVDQSLFNYLFYPKIGRLPSKYAIFNFFDKSDIEVYLKNLRTKVPIEEIEEAIKNPTVVHNTLCYPKLWSIDAAYQTMYTNCGERHNCSCQRDFNLWHSFARQTDYYDEIIKFTGVKKL